MSYVTNLSFVFEFKYRNLLLILKYQKAYTHEHA